jgi:hypothetical protein
MALEYYELQMRQSGNLAAAEFARVTREQYGDIALPNNSHVEKTPVEFKTFSDESRKALEDRGFVIYGLQGESIISLRDSGRKFQSDWHRSYHEFEARTSKLSQVAINPNPDKFFIHGSNNKRLNTQEEMIAKFSKELTSGSNRVNGVRAIMGGAADYVELTFRHFDTTQSDLFGPDYNYKYTRTDTPTNGSNVAIVGHFSVDYGLRLDVWLRDRGNANVLAVPLVVPA